MATFLAVNLVKYLCTCGKRQPICRLYLCRHCLKLRCGECVQHEVDTPYCPNCLENLPSAEAKMRKNRCSNCFDCPSCGHTLMTRATSLMVANPDDANKSTPKKMYYMACGFCRWTTRDVGMADQLSSSGGWQDQENEQVKRINSLLDYHRQMSQREKAEKERKKYVKRRTHLYYSDKYGLTSVAAAKRKSIAAMSNMSIKDGDEPPAPVEPGETVTDFDSLPDEIFTEAVDLSKASSMKQRLATPEFQPPGALKLYPQHKHLLIRKSLRCKECEHNLSKPDFNPVSIKFKIQLIALNHVPEIRILSPAVFLPQKETLVTLTLSNPSVYNTTVHFLSLDDENETGDEVNAKCVLPKGELVIARRDDAAMYDDQNQLQQEFKDDPGVIAFRKSNKIGIFMRVKPNLKEGDVKVRFRMQHEYRNTTTALQSEDKEPQIVWLEHTIYMAVGQIQSK
ncbi:dynactin subunit 4-like [Haliotis cracherodii]|uniref:dynactin subunit 4-like n=1 Tax=Haliotis rufescens TaxID=6454 RepID=UPI001EB09103|nr:dynactin subunit 4-like [Haliotis rufescens]